MADYTELARRLRGMVGVRDEKCEGCPYGEDFPCCVDCMDKTHKEAADAIEELRGQIDGWVEQERKALIKSLPKWIPVTERLPLLMTPVLITDGIEVDIAWMFGVPARWAVQYTDIDEDSITHWMDLPKTPLPEPPKEEQT